MNERNLTLLTDLYELTMMNGYFDMKRDEKVVFDVFYRNNPYDGGYAIVAGLEQVIDYIKNLHFDREDIEYLRELELFDDKFLKYLENFKFTGNIYAIKEGTVVFPMEPLLKVEAPIIEAQLVETAILNIINHESLIATKASRVCEAAKGAAVMEFGLRRAQGADAGIYGARAAVIGGCSSTSNVLAGQKFDIPVAGTHAHSWIMSFDNEYEAFKKYAELFPNNATLLVDTYDTLRSGIPNAIKTFKFLENQGLPTNHIGIRIDSGDLARLSKEARRMLNEAGFPQATICLSNGLNAETIETLTVQGACFNSLGVGDNISKPEGRMGCVYKLVALKEKGIWQPKIKLSNDTIKIVNPDYKNLYRAYDKDTNYAIADIITRKTEKLTNKEDIRIINLQDNLKQKDLTNFYLKKLQVPIFKKGDLIYDDPDIWTKQAYCNEQMSHIYEENKRTIMPEAYYVDGTKDYIKFKNNFIEKTRKLTRKH